MSTYERRVTEYLMVRKYSDESLSIAVNEAIKEGWQPHGEFKHMMFSAQNEEGIDGYKHVYLQAMVKFETTEDDVTYGIGIYSKCDHEWEERACNIEEGKTITYCKKCELVPTAEKNECVE